MIWFKENFRALSANPKMSLSELGALWQLCRFAWNKLGITEDDLPELARELREPVEMLTFIWPDFTAIAEARNGRYMLGEMWDALDSHKKRIDAASNAGRKSAETRQAKDVVPATTARPTEKKKEKKIAATPEIVAIFEHWKVVMNSPKSVLDEKRVKIITKALSLGYTEEALKIAVSGCAKSDWHMGQDKNNTTKYNGIDVIFRNADQIEKFIDRAAGVTNGNTNAGTQGVSITNSLAHSFKCEEI